MEPIEYLTHRYSRRPPPPPALCTRHLHNELCWPQLLMLTGPVSLSIVSLAHQNPGRMSRIGVQSQSGVLRAPGAVSDGCPLDSNDENGVPLACRNVRPSNRTAWSW